MGSGMKTKRKYYICAKCGAGLVDLPGNYHECEPQKDTKEAKTEKKTPGRPKKK